MSRLNYDSFDLNTDLNKSQNINGNKFFFSRSNVKNVRQPLADAMLVHSDSSAVHSLESKPLVALHACTETKTVASELQQEDRSKKLGMKLMHTEINYHNGKHINSAFKLNI